jgi:hypothetical protein
MIVEAIRELYVQKAQRRGAPSGNPTGSRLGKCVAQLQLLGWPSVGKPEPYQPRNLMAMEAGDIHATWMNGNIRTAFRGIWGLREQPFFFPVPIGDEWRGQSALERIDEKFHAKWGADGRLWGTVQPGFYPPKIEEANGKLRVGGLDQEIGGKPLAKAGMILDPDAKDAEGKRRPTLWVPVFIDGAIRHPAAGLTVVEEKSLSNYQFRRSLLGYMDYEKRAQLAAAVTAMRWSSAIWLCNRRETMHLAEIAFLRGASRTLVRLRDLGGEWDTYVVRNAEAEQVQRVAHGEILAGADEEVGALPGDPTWDVAQVETPWDEGLVPELQRRVLEAVLFDGDYAKIRREYGPDFACADCGGAGERECGFCHGVGLSPRAKAPKPCPRCASPPKAGKEDLRGARPGRQRCGECAGKGTLERVELPQFPCGYCPSVMKCWAPAGVERVIDTKPHHYVTLAGFRASGIEFHPVEPRPARPAEKREDEEEEE